MNTTQQPKKSALKNGTFEQPQGADGGADFSTQGFVMPALVRELFTAKRAELVAKQKLRMQLQTELKLR